MLKGKQGLISKMNSMLDQQLSHSEIRYMSIQNQTSANKVMRLSQTNFITTLKNQPPSSQSEPEQSLRSLSIADDEEEEEK